MQDAIQFAKRVYAQKQLEALCTAHQPQAPCCVKNRAELLRQLIGQVEYQFVPFDCIFAQHRFIFQLK
jgi:hypothetical protein